MTPSETINRAVCKVKGELYHEEMAVRDDDIYSLCVDWVTCSCGFRSSRPLMDDHLLDANPDYTSEAHIREAVRILCDTEAKKARFVYRLDTIVVPREVFAQGRVNTTHAFDCRVATAEQTKQALLPIAERVLEGER